MQVYEYTVSKKADGKRVVALGFFDGVHIGHRSLLLAAREAADRLGLPLAVFTFPAESAGLKDTGRLYSTAEKLEILEELGTDQVILADFSSVMNISAEVFVRSSLLSDMGAVAAVCGKDFRFGRGAEGDAGLLFRLMEEGGGECITVSDSCLYGAKVSTTAIKGYLAAGDIDKANAMLGAPLKLSGRVAHGLGLGRRLGFPTVNVPIGEKAAIVRHGVYRSEVEVAGVRYPALTNIGTCPTVGEREAHAESYIIGEVGAIYGEKIKVFLLEFLRDEKRFESEKELIMQINVDINRVKSQIDKENGDN